MFRHIVMLWLKECTPEKVRDACSQLRHLAGKVAGLLSIEVSEDAHRGDGSCHLCLNMLFVSKAALDAFRANPDRLPLDKTLREQLEHTTYADYPIAEPIRSMPKLYTFIGPSNRDEDTLGRLLDVGMTGIRLSMEHHTLEDCLPIVENLRAAAESRKASPEILLEHVPLQSVSTSVRRLCATGFIHGLPDSPSFVQNLRALIGPSVRLLARIDSAEDAELLPSLIEYADELVIARFGMMRNLPAHTIPSVQRSIAQIAHESGVPFMIAGGLLSSMRQSLYPTAAELCDIHNAVSAGVSSLMLTRETSLGSYPVEAMETLRLTAEAALLP